MRGFWIVAGLASLSFVAIGAGGTHREQTRDQWEYCTVWNEKDTTKLNALGREGWELVTVTTASFGGSTGKEVGWAYFKRRIPAS